MMNAPFITVVLVLCCIGGVSAKLDISHADSLQPHLSDSGSDPVNHAAAAASVPSAMPKSAQKLFQRMGFHLDTSASAKVEVDVAGETHTEVIQEPKVIGRCGVEIADPLKKVINDFNTYWPTIDKKQRDEMCSYLGPGDNELAGRGWRYAKMSWDIVEMYVGSYNHTFLPQQDKDCGQPWTKCEYTVSVNGQCSYTGSVNYVIFGHMCRLCGKWETSMKLLIWGHKGNNLFSKLAGNYEESMAWAIAGYRNWGLPSGSAIAQPKNDRPMCPVTCGNWKAKPFNVHWHPYELQVSDKRMIMWKHQPTFDRLGA